MKAIYVLVLFSILIYSCSNQPQELEKTLEVSIEKLTNYRDNLTNQISYEVGKCHNHPKHVLIENYMSETSKKYKTLEIKINNELAYNLNTGKYSHSLDFVNDSINSTHINIINNTISKLLLDQNNPIIIKAIENFVNNSNELHNNLVLNSKRIPISNKSKRIYLMQLLTKILMEEINYLEFFYSQVGCIIEDYTMIGIYGYIELNLAFPNQVNNLILGLTDSKNIKNPKALINQDTINFENGNSTVYPFKTPFAYGKHKIEVEFIYQDLTNNKHRSINRSFYYEVIPKCN